MLTFDHDESRTSLRLLARESGALREMIERAGLTVVAETAILFLPGWLRMLDQACHAWCRPLAAVTGACVWPFMLLDRHVPVVRRHGYLLATVAVKPDR